MGNLELLQQDLWKLAGTKEQEIALQLDPTPDHSWSEWTSKLLETGKYQQAQLPEIQKLLQEYYQAEQKQLVNQPITSYSSFEEVQNA